MRKRLARFSTVLAIMAMALTLIGPAVAQAATTHNITFENDTAGAKPNGWQSIDSAVTFFTDSNGANLQVADWGGQSNGQALGVLGDDPSFLIMDFSVPMQSISLAFGNDDPGWSNPGDEAVLTVFNGAAQVGQVKVVLNRNDIMDQTISFSGSPFTSATFFYNVTLRVGLIEIVDDIVLEEALIEADIDIKPGSDPNSINPGSKGNIPVAILTTLDFDASQVDPATVSFAGAAPLRWAMEDVDSDGDVDMVLHFSTRATNLAAGDTEATLAGKTLAAFGALDFSGTDTVRVVPPIS